MTTMMSYGDTQLGPESSETFIEEALQPVLAGSLVTVESPSSSSALLSLGSENLPAPVLDLALLADPQAQSLEDSQVKQGTSLLYGGSFDGAEEYFDALTSIRANPRFLLHSAEAVLFRALLSLNSADVSRANSSLGLVEKQAVANIAAWNGLAFRTQKAKLTKAVATGLTSVKAAVRSPLQGMQTSLKAMVTKLRTGKEMAAVATTDEWESSHFDEQRVIGATYTIPVLEIAEERHKERQRQKAVARCTAIQAEAVLLQEVLQVAVEGESAMGGENWTAALKLGLGIRKAWSLYQNSQKQVEKVANLEASAAVTEQLEQQQQKKESSGNVRMVTDRERVGGNPSEKVAMGQEDGKSNRGHKPGMAGAVLVGRSIGGGPLPEAQESPLVEEGRANEAAKTPSAGAKQSFASKWFGKSSATKTDECGTASQSAPTANGAAATNNGKGEGSGFWKKTKGFLKKRIGKRGGDESDDEEERRVRREPIDDSGWGSDEDDFSSEPTGFRKLWRAGSRRSSLKSVGSRRVSRRSSVGSQSELASQSGACKLGATGAQTGDMKGVGPSSTAVHPVDGSIKKGAEGLRAESEGFQKFGSAVSPKTIEEESGTPASPSQEVTEAGGGLDTDAVLRSIKAQIEFGLGLLQLLVSLIPTKVQKAAEVLGFAGHRSAGLELLEKVAAEQSEWAQLASIMLLHYHTVIMSFQPESFAHSRDSRRILTALKQTWRSQDISPGALSALLTARRLRYDGELSEAVQILEESDANDRPDSALPPEDGTVVLGELNKNVLYELGWCHLLQGRYAEAADVFQQLRNAQRIGVVRPAVIAKRPELETSSLLSKDEGLSLAAGEPAESNEQLELSDNARASLQTGSGSDSPLNSKAALKHEVCHVDGPWGQFYLSLEAACRWEAGEEQHPAAMRLMKEIVESAAWKVSRPTLDGSDASFKASPSPFEAHWLRLARDFTQHHGESPLFPAIETVALWNGFQQMSRADLEKHVQTVGTVLSKGEVSWGNKKRQKAGGSSKNQASTEGSEQETTAKLPGDLLSGDPLTDPEAGDGSSAEAVTSSAETEASASEAVTSAALLETAEGSPAVPTTFAAVSEPPAGVEYGHSWSVESEMLCKFLLGCCYKHLGETEKASDALAFAISVGQHIGGHIVPFACYELGSMLLQSAATANEGLVYLEQAINYPPHYFQGRLKFLVSERSRTYKEEQR